MKELNILSRTEVGSNLYLGDSEDESDTKIFCVPTLKLASNQLHTSSSNWCQGSHNKLKGTMIRVLVENNFDRDNVCHMAIKVFHSKAKFRRRTSHEPNRMQMRKILCSPSLAFDSAHVKYGV